MCGIVGKLYQQQDRPVEGEALVAMCETLVHPGPDDEGFYLNGNVGLAMRRLAIIDLDTGRQPLHNEDCTVSTVYNGENYNLPEPGRDLEASGQRLHTHSDTERIVPLYRE